MLSVEAVPVIFSVTGCQSLSTPIRSKPIPKNCDGRTSCYIFAAGFNAANPEEKMIDSTEKISIVFHDYLQIVNAMTSIRF